MLKYIYLGSPRSKSNSRATSDYPTASKDSTAEAASSG